MKKNDNATEAEQSQADAQLARESNLTTECPTNGRSLAEAYDELEREFNVRSRCFPKWVDEGRISRSDAKDRLERLSAACYFLHALSCGDLAACIEAMEAYGVPNGSAKAPF